MFFQFTKFYPETQNLTKMFMFKKIINMNIKPINFKKYNIKYHKLYMGHIDKRQIVADNKIDLFIDDALKTCTEVQSLGVKSLLMTTRLNKDVDIGNITRVNNWDEINEIIKSYNKAINDGNVIVEKFKGTNEEGENEWVK